MVAEAAAAARDPWWIIGSSAAALHGADVRDVRDVDLLTSPRDARGMLDSLGLRPLCREPDPLFRSTVFGVWPEPPLPVEIMAGLEVAGPSGWRPVNPTSRLKMTLEGRTLFVPAVAELAAILASFGRPKDLERARLLLS